VELDHLPIETVCALPRQNSYISFRIVGTEERKRKESEKNENKNGFSFHNLVYHERYNGSSKRRSSAN
jgi:hypothetical protein